MSVIGMTFYYEETLEFSRKKLNLVDNILFLVYILSNYTFCFMSSSMLDSINCKEMPKDKGYTMTKKVLLLIMGLQVFLFVIALLIVSFYVPMIQVEKNLFVLLVSAMGVNSIIFTCCMIFFIWTLRYDLYFVNLNLEILPDIEYFIDFEENEKLEI